MRVGKNKQIRKFIAQHQLFTWSEFASFLDGLGTSNKLTQRRILQNQLLAGRLVGVRRGLYMSVGDAFEPDEMIPDPYLVAGKATHDAVVGYHSALEYYGVAYSVFFQSTFLTHRRINPFSFRDHDYISTVFPAALVRKKQEFFLCDTFKRSGVVIRMTSRERTFVDVLDRLNISGGSEEVIRSLEMMTSLDIDKIIQYALLLENETTIARVGYLLEGWQKELHVDDSQLLTLKKKPLKAQTTLMIAIGKSEEAH